jgi:hypothetical protein
MGYHGALEFRPPVETVIEIDHTYTAALGEGLAEPGDFEAFRHGQGFQ